MLAEESAVTYFTRVETKTDLDESKSDDDSNALLANNETSTHDAPVQIENKDQPSKDPFNDLRSLTTVIGEDKVTSRAKLESDKQRILRDIKLEIGSRQVASRDLQFTPQ